MLDMRAIVLDVSIGVNAKNSRLQLGFELRIFLILGMELQVDHFSPIFFTIATSQGEPKGQTSTA